jgi:hypothetical protein
MGNPLVRFCEGQESNCDMEEILWHCRESRQKQRKQISSYSHGRLLSTRKDSIFVDVYILLLSGRQRYHLMPQKTR